MFAQHPTVAAPAAIPERSRIIPSAAELMGSVKIIPINTDTIIPIKKGACCVPAFTRLPRNAMNLEMGGPKTRPEADPVSMQNKGVRSISIFVFLLMSLPM